MSEDESKRDTISEQEYNTQMASASTSPEEDNLGDSEADAGSEFLMGLNYMPDEKSEFEGAGDEPGEIVFSDTKPKSSKEKLKKEIKIPEMAKIISPNRPEPCADLDNVSDTH